MRVGTIGFIGANLTSAREARQISQASLARLIDVSRATISDYERNIKSPSPSTLQRIEEVLNIPASYFQRIFTPKERGAIFYRSMSSATRTARMSAEQRFVWLKEIVRYLREFVNFPVVNFPKFDVPENPRKIDSELIEELAAETRRFWGLGNGTISNVIWLLENNGAIVGRFPLDAETLDAFSEFSPHDDTPYVILGADKNVCVRSRFDAAHELAHLVLHRHIDKTRISNVSDFSLIEKQAHRFAGAFLFPAQSYLKEVNTPDLDTFRYLKSKWLVSIQLLIQRGSDLGVISPDRTTRLWKNCMRRGWKYREPLDDQLMVEQPRILSRSFKMLLDENVQSKYDILSALPFAVGDLVELTGLPRTYLQEDVSSVVSLKNIPTKLAEEQQESEPNTELKTGQVIAFRRKQA